MTKKVTKKMAKSSARASSQKKSSKKVSTWSSPISRARSNRLVMWVVVVLVALVGTYFYFNSHAEAPYPTGANEIVAQLDNVADYQAVKQADGSVLNLLPPGEVIVTGDGSLYCNTNGDGSVTEGNIGLGLVKQLYNQVGGADAKNLSNQQKANPPKDNVPANTTTLTVYSNTGDWSVSNLGDTTGVFDRVAKIMQHKCQGEFPTHKVAALPEFVDVDAQDQQVSWLSRQFFASAAAATAPYFYGYATQNMVNHTDNARNNNGYKPYVENVATTATNGNCLFYHSTSSWTRGSSVWTKHMAATQALAHDPNLYSEVNSCSKGNWWAYGENVGEGPNVPDIFTAYMNSPDHRANVLDHSGTHSGSTCSYQPYYPCYNRSGTAVYVDGNSLRWSTTKFAGYPL